MQILQTYYSKLQQALETFDEVIDRFETDKTDEYDKVNFSAILHNLYLARTNIEHYNNAHKWFRLSKEDFIKQMVYSLANTVEQLHIVKEYETPLSIAEKYKVTLESILKKNNITTSEFTPGRIIKIETSNLSQKEIYQKIMTYGDQTNDLVFGNDFPNEITVDGQGDLFAIESSETLKQGINNIINSDIGSYPMEPSFGVDRLIGNEMPTELRENMISVRIAETVEADKRIKAITDIKFEEGNANITARTIKNQNINLGIV